MDEDAWQEVVSGVRNEWCWCWSRMVKKNMHGDEQYVMIYDCDRWLEVMDGEDDEQLGWWTVLMTKSADDVQWWWWAVLIMKSGGDWDDSCGCWLRRRLWVMFRIGGARFGRKYVHYIDLSFNMRAVVKRIMDKYFSRNHILSAEYCTHERTEYVNWVKLVMSESKILIRARTVVQFTIPWWRVHCIIEGRLLLMM